MAEIPVVLSGFIIDKYGRAGAPVTVAGQLSIAGLSIGGGPIIGDGGGSPPGIWGPTDPRPTPPIANVPGAPGYPGGGPPGIWGPTDPRPQPPIVIPPDFLPPGVSIPEGHVLVIVYDPATGQHKVTTTPKPGPGYTPPSGGAAPQPV